MQPKELLQQTKLQLEQLVAASSLDEIRLILIEHLRLEAIMLQQQIDEESR